MTQNTDVALASQDAAPFLMAAAFEVQDDLLRVCNDLDRLSGLLAEAGAGLGIAFQGACDLIARRRAECGAEERAFLATLEQRLAGAVTALQFEDMATQLVAHARQVLRSGADRLAADAFGDEDGAAVVETAPRRPNPVTQVEMDAGSVELF